MSQRITQMTRKTRTIGTTRTRGRVLGATALLAVAGAIGATAPAEAASATACTSFAGCSAAGYATYGYPAVYQQSWWGQYSGHNCTNYAAYRLSRAGVANPGISGNAGNWGLVARARGYAVNATPAVGAVAWYGFGSSYSPRLGHVAIVEAVTQTSIVVSEDSWTTGVFRYRVISRSDAAAMPTAFIHFADAAVGAGGSTVIPATRPTVTTTNPVAARATTGAKASTGATVSHPARTAAHRDDHVWRARSSRH